MCKVVLVSAKLLEHSRHFTIGSYLPFVVNLFLNEYWNAIMSKRLQEDIMGGTQRETK